MEEEAASSTPQSSGHPTHGAAAVRPARRRTPGWASRTPSGDTLAGALSTARELLHHLPSPTVSLGAMRQWRDDVDRLLGMVHTGSIRPRPRSPWHRHEASASERTPSVRTALTGDLRTELNRRRVEGDAQVPLEGPGDLRDKLNRRRACRDACISSEKTRERCGRLVQDSAAVAPRAPGDARFQTSIPLAGVGCAAQAAAQVSATSARKIRRYNKPVRIPVGLCHCHYSSRWRHRRIGNLLPCSPVWTSPDLAHEPSPRIHLLLGRALCVVRGELRQRLPAARSGGTPPHSETGIRGDPPSVHFPLHQGTWDNPPYLGCIHHHCFPPGGT
jgi:hypothetical protein